MGKESLVSQLGTAKLGDVRTPAAKHLLRIGLQYLVRGDQLFCHGQSWGTTFEGDYPRRDSSKVNSSLSFFHVGGTWTPGETGRYLFLVPLRLHRGHGRVRNRVTPQTPRLGLPLLPNPGHTPNPRGSCNLVLCNSVPRQLKKEIQISVW